MCDLYPSLHPYPNSHPHLQSPFTNTCTKTLSTYCPLTIPKPFSFSCPCIKTHPQNHPSLDLRHFESLPTIRHWHKSSIQQRMGGTRGTIWLTCEPRFKAHVDRSRRQKSNNIVQRLEPEWLRCFDTYLGMKRCLKRKAALHPTEATITMSGYHKALAVVPWILSRLLFSKPPSVGNGCGTTIKK